MGLYSLYKARPMYIYCYVPSSVKTTVCAKNCFNKSDRGMMESRPCSVTSLTDSRPMTTSRLCSVTSSTDSRPMTTNQKHFDTCEIHHKEEKSNKT